MITILNSYKEFKASSLRILAGESLTEQTPVELQGKGNKTQSFISFDFDYWLLPRLYLESLRCALVDLNFCSIKTLTLPK